MKNKFVIVAMAAMLIMLVSAGTASASVTVEKIEFLTNTPEGENTPIWTADGNQIMYVFQRTNWNDRDSYMMNADGSNQHRTYLGEGMLVGYSDLSPNGKDLLVGKNYDYWYNIYKLNLNTGNLEPLATDPSINEAGGYWSPDGTKIVYLQQFPNSLSRYELWLMDSNGSNKHRLGTSSNLAYGQDWSPDGLKIIYSVGFPQTNADLWMINADGTNQVQITDTSYGEWSPCFSPDGQYISYLSNEEGTADLWIRNLDGSYRLKLANTNTGDASPMWSPNGKKIVFVSNEYGNLDIAVITLKFDTDGDGLPDDQDMCPIEDSTGFDADNNGCIDTLNGLNQIINTLPNDVLSDETKNSLESKVENAQKSTDKEADNAAINQLNAFIHEIEAQRGNKISLDAADMLIRYAQNIIAQIEAE